MTLNFHPRRTWPAALPAFSWKDHLICGFERESGRAVDLFVEQSCSLEEAIYACHPQLGLAELSRLVVRLKALAPQDSVRLMDVMSLYNLRWSDRLDQITEKVVATPKSFQDWIDEKGVGPRDLAPLMAVSLGAQDPSLLMELLEILPRLNLSKSSGVQALELVIDLALLKTPLAELLPGELAGEAWLQKLIKLRKPMTVNRDEVMQSRVRQLAWPSHVQAQWVRQGDESGIEIKLRVKSPDELNKKLEKLNFVGEAWRNLKN